MRNFILATAAVAALGLCLPAVSAQAEDSKVVIRTGGDHHRHWNRGHSKKVVIIKKHHGDGWRRHRAEGGRVVIKER